MSDLISRQKALEHLRKRLIQTANNNVGFVCDAGLTFEDASERVKTWLDEVPSIDAVPVIRCKDCKHRPKRLEEGKGEGFNLEFPDYKCPCQCDDGWYNWMPDDDWFCGNGERKES